MRGGGSPERIDVLLLCGGQSSRMGGHDKAWLPWHGRPMVEHLLDLVAAWPAQGAPAVMQVWVSANRDLERYQTLGLPVLPDRRDGWQGPLAGIEAALLASTADALWVLPCDMPGVPIDLGPRLVAALQDGPPVARTRDPAQLHPILCAVHRRALGSLQSRLDQGLRAVQGWQDAVGCTDVKVDQWLVNGNTPEAWAAKA